MSEEPVGRFRPALLVFAVGACVMALEVTAGRMIARVLGQSLYAWTSVIGVVLGGLVFGNSLGGRLADRWAPRPLLSLLLALASLTCFMIPALHAAVGTWETLWEYSWPARILIHMLAVFLAPSVLLGAVTPVAARAAVASGARPGRTLGRLYAWNAAGSIAGTFAAGYALIAALGTLGVIVGLGALLGGLAGWVGRYRLARAWWAVCVLMLWAGFSPDAAGRRAGEELKIREGRPGDVVYQEESRYSYIAVKTLGEPDVRGLYLDKMMHSEMDLRDPSRLLYKYAWVYEAVLNERTPPGRPIRAFVIGGGAYTFPQYISLTRPGSLVDVAEIDPAVTRAALEACGLRPSTPLNIHHMDARRFVAGRARRAAPDETELYDYVFGDTFNDYSVPYHLTTLEFTRQLADLMSRDGLYLLNMIDRFDSGRFLGAIVATFRQVFPGVHVFFCHRNLSQRGTYVVIGAKRPLEAFELERVTERLRLHGEFFGFLLRREQVDELLDRTRARPLTDDYAPVENLLADVVRHDAPDGLDVYYLKAGLRDAERGRYGRAALRFERALEINPANAQALYNLGVARMAEGRPYEALRAFGAALQTDPDYLDVRNNAGVVLAGLGHWEEAAGQFEEILSRRPDSVDARVNLATIRAQQGRLEEARALLREAVELDPDHAQARQNLQALTR